MLASSTPTFKVRHLPQLLCQAQIVDEAGTEINDNPLKSLDNLFIPFDFQRDLSAARSSKIVPKGTKRLGKYPLILIAYGNVPKGNTRGPIGTFSTFSDLALWGYLP
jgi:hypothetical protein